MGRQPAPPENRLYFADYRESTGCKWPFRLRRAVGPDTVEETTFDRFRINTKIDPKKFEVPEDDASSADRRARVMRDVPVVSSPWCVRAGLRPGAAATHGCSSPSPIRPARCIPGATVTVDGQEAATRAVATRGGADVGSRHRGDRRPRARPLRRPGGVSRIRDRRRHGRARPDRRQQADDRAGDPEADRRDHGRTGQAGGGGRCARCTFGSALTREQIDALSDDPNEMRAAAAGHGRPGAVIRVDSFEGGELPPKSQIKSIHVTRDTLRRGEPQRRRDLHRHHHAAGHRRAARRRALQPARRLAERPQPVHADEGTGADAELRLQFRRLDRAAEELVLRLGRRDDVVRHAEPERGAAQRRARPRR